MEQNTNEQASPKHPWANKPTKTSWKPGQSGNPGGKSKSAQILKAEAELTKARILENITNYVDAHQRTLVQMDELILSCETPFDLAKLMAVRKNIEAMMQYVIPKAQQKVDITTNNEPIQFVLPSPPNSNP